MRELVINAGSHETRIAELENKRLVELRSSGTKTPASWGASMRRTTVVRHQAPSSISAREERLPVCLRHRGARHRRHDAGGGQAPRRTRAPRKATAIETMLKKGQHHGAGGRDRLAAGARLTSHHHPRYTVLMPTVSTLGVSGKSAPRRSATGSESPPPDPAQGHGPHHPPLRGPREDLADATTPTSGERSRPNTSA